MPPLYKRSLEVIEKDINARLKDAQIHGNTHLEEILNLALERINYVKEYQEEWGDWSAD